MSNQALEEYLKRHKIKLKRSKVGDKNVLELMRKIGTNFVGTEWTHNLF